MQVFHFIYSDITPEDPPSLTHDYLNCDFPEVGWKLEYKYSPRSPCSGGEERLQACKLQSLVGKEGEGHRTGAFFTMLNLTPGVATHTNHVIAVNCV